MKVLLAGVSTRALAQSAVAAGAEVISLDFFGDYDQPPGAEVYALGRDLGKPLTLSSLAVEAQKLAPAVDAIVIESGLENEPLLTDIGCPEQRCFNTSQAVNAARSLRGLTQALEGTGMAIPEIVLPGETLPKSGHWLVKDGKRSGGLGVREWNGADALSSHEILERFIPGQLISACFIANGKGALLVGMTRQYAGVADLNAAPFIWSGNVAPYEDEALQNLIESSLQVLVQKCDLAGLNGIDFILGEEGPMLLEINPRPPASFELFERLLGVNAFRLHINGCQGSLPVRLPSPKPHVAWGKGILYAGQTLVLGDTTAWQTKNIVDIPHPNEIIHKGSPVCTLLAKGDDPSTCWQSVLENAEIIQKLIRSTNAHQ